MHFVARSSQHSTWPENACEWLLSFGCIHHTLYQVACIHSILGRNEQALAWLELIREHRISLLAAVQG